MARYKELYEAIQIQNYMEVSADPLRVVNYPTFLKLQSSGRMQEGPALSPRDLRNQMNEWSSIIELQMSCRREGRSGPQET